MPLNRPYASEILAALAVQQQEQLLPVLSQQLAGESALRQEHLFQARICASLLQLLSRETQLSDTFRAEENSVMDQLGFTGADTLCRALDQGLLDDQMSIIAKLLQPSVFAKLAIDSPAYKVRPQES